MKLGAQFYTIRDKAKTPEGIRESMLKMKEIGYTVAQMSGIGPIAAELLRDYSEEAGLPITCTHSSFDRIVNDTDPLTLNSTLQNRELHPDGKFSLPLCTLDKCPSDISVLKEAHSIRNPKGISISESGCIT